MMTCYDMKIVVHITGGDGSSLNGKSEISDRNLVNITRSLIMSSINKNFWCIAYQYAVCIFRRT